MSIVLWNRLPEDVVLLSDLDSFKQAVSKITLLPINQKYIFILFFLISHLTNTILLFSFSYHSFSLNFHLFLLFLHRCTKIPHNTRKRVLENIKKERKNEAVRINLKYLFAINKKHKFCLIHLVIRRVNISVCAKAGVT